MLRLGSQLAARLFAAGVTRRNARFDSGSGAIAHLPAPVVSIGNLSVGGTGKTPTTIALAAALEARAWSLDVLTRGYRRASRALVVVNGESPRPGPEQAGDEPLLIAERIQGSVLVHPDRFRSGLLGERKYGARLHLLDDGFQHRQLARCFDLVLITETDLHDKLLPAGRLREPLPSLARASALLFVESRIQPVLAFDDGAPPPPDAEIAERLAPVRNAVTQALAGVGATPPLFLASKRVGTPIPAVADIPPSFSLASPLLAFCGLASPHSFWNALSALGLSPVASVAFRDHHRYRVVDLAALARRAREAGAEAFITTAKDAVKLRAFGDTEAGREFLSRLWIVPLEMYIPQLPALVELIETAAHAHQERLLVPSAM